MILFFITGAKICISQSSLEKQKQQGVRACMCVRVRVCVCMFKQTERDTKRETETKKQRERSILINWLMCLQRLLSLPCQVGQQVGEDLVLQFKSEVISLETRKGLMLDFKCKDHLLAQFLLTQGTQTFVLFRLLTNWMRPTQHYEGQFALFEIH